MLTYYCPKCWVIIKEGQLTCPDCGYPLDDFVQLDYDDKLIAALQHPVAERKIMAAQVLGNRQSKRALPVFKKILESDEIDYFFLRAILLAVAKYEDPEREEILVLATKHPVNLISQMAVVLLNEINSGIKQDGWDRNTG